ncbi:ROK family protein [Brachybacterium sp. AOP43-C2-M15]|uniref:ROK family protein n=1 Tax=Brachybacterium sp. AOP43-C2-M15 TaxID=3457661 RepID=UPI004034111D
MDDAETDGAGADASGTDGAGARGAAGAIAPVRHAIGVDVGGTRTKIGLVAEDGSLGIPYSLPTPSDPHELAAMIAAETASLAERAGLTREAPVGIVVPGILDETREVVELAVNLGWEDLPLGALLREAIDLPLALGHDVRAGGLAEAAWGAGRLFEQSPPSTPGTTRDDLAPAHEHGPEARRPALPALADLMFVPIGTGIAAAVIRDGGVLGDRFTGEIGQVRVEEPYTGQTLRLEEVASASAIGRRFAALTEPADQTLVLTDGGRPAARQVVDLAREHDPAAEKILFSALDTLAQALAAIISSVGTVPIVIGGGLAEGGTIVLDTLRDSIASRLGVVPAPPVLPSSLGMWAGCQGAGLLGMIRATREGPRP